LDAKTRAHALSVDRHMTHLFKLFNILTVFAISVIYVELLKYFMSLYISLFGDGYSDLSKISLTGTSTFLSLCLVLLGNRCITRQNVKLLGFFCSSVALIYFYQIHRGGNLIVNVLLSFNNVYSAFAFLFFVVAPVIVGLAINKKMLMDGFQPPKI
jgi:hypothetical protein